MSSPLTAAQSTPLPYGLRQLMLTPYADAQGSILGNISYPLPIAMTLGFSETEQFDELRGDDRLVAVHGRGPQVDWSLEAGGLNMTAWSIISGASVIEEGVSPWRQTALQKSWDNERPYFRIDGRVISDTGGNVVATIYRAKANGKLQANHKNGAFQTSQIDGIGLPLLNDDANWLYQIVQNETDTVLSGTPTPNPIPVPSNVFVDVIGTDYVTLSWNDIVSASGYVIQQSIDGGVTWTDVAAGTNDVQTITTTGDPDGGSWTATFDSDTTTAIPWDATAAEVESALELLASIGIGNVSVTGGPGPSAPWVVEFVGTLAQAEQSLLTIVDTGLTGGTSPAIAVTHTTEGAGGGGTPTLNATYITDLTAATQYLYQIAAVVDGTLGDFSNPVSVLTLASS